MSYSSILQLLYVEGFMDLSYVSTPLSLHVSILRYRFYTSLWYKNGRTITSNSIKQLEQSAHINTSSEHHSSWHHFISIVKEKNLHTSIIKFSYQQQVKCQNQMCKTPLTAFTLVREFDQDSTMTTYVEKRVITQVYCSIIIFFIQ